MLEDNISINLTLVINYELFLTCPSLDIPSYPVDTARIFYVYIKDSFGVSCTLYPLNQLKLKLNNVY